MDNISLRYFETQPRAIVKQLCSHDILALVDIELNKDNVVPNVLSRKEEYQGEMPWENIEFFRAMFVGDNDLERKI